MADCRMQEIRAPVSTKLVRISGVLPKRVRTVFGDPFELTERTWGNFVIGFYLLNFRNFLGALPDLGFNRHCEFCFSLHILIKCPKLPQ